MDACLPCPLRCSPGLKPGGESRGNGDKRGHDGGYFLGGELHLTSIAPSAVVSEDHGGRRYAGQNGLVVNLATTLQSVVWVIVSIFQICHLNAPVTAERICMRPLRIPDHE